MEKHDIYLLARHIERRHVRESYWKRCEERGWEHNTSSWRRGTPSYRPTDEILIGREKKTNINVDGDFMTSGKRLVKSLRKNWNVSKIQERRILGQAQEVGLEWWAHNNNRAFVNEGEWHTGITKAGKLILQFDGYRTWGGDQKKGIQPRIYLTRKQVGIDV